MSHSCNSRSTPTPAFSHVTLVMQRIFPTLAHWSWTLNSDSPAGTFRGQPHQAFSAGLHLTTSGQSGYSASPSLLATSSDWPSAFQCDPAADLPWPDSRRASAQCCIPDECQALSPILSPSPPCESTARTTCRQTHEGQPLHRFELPSGLARSSLLRHHAKRGLNICELRAPQLRSHDGLFGHRNRSGFCFRDES